MHHVARRLVVAVLAPLAGVISPTGLSAQIAPGSTLTFTGTADATDIGLGGVMLDFTKQVVAAGSGNTGTFASLNGAKGNGRQGKIADLRVGNGPEVIPSFLQFGGYKFTLLGLPAGRYGQDACYVDPAPGQTCTPYQSVQGDPSVNAGLSPFYVANAATPNADGSLNSTAAFDVYGTVRGPGNTVSPFTGTIAASFVGRSYQEVLYTLEQQGLRGVTFTGTFTTGAVLMAALGQAPFSDAALDDPALLDAGGVDATATPEPATVALVAGGLLALVPTARRRRKSA